MLQVTSIKYVIQGEAHPRFIHKPDNMFIRDDLLERFVAYHKYLALKMFGKQLTVFIDTKHRS